MNVQWSTCVFFQLNENCIFSMWFECNSKIHSFFLMKICTPFFFFFISSEKRRKILTFSKRFKRVSLTRWASCLLERQWFAQGFVLFLLYISHIYLLYISDAYIQVILNPFPVFTAMKISYSSWNNLVKSWFPFGKKKINKF